MFTLLLASCASKETDKSPTEVIESKINKDEEQVKVQIGYVFSESGLNLRNSPSLEAKTLYTIPFGQKIAILETNENKLKIEGIEGNWIKVNDGKNDGYVFDGFVLPYLPLKRSDELDIKSFMINNFKLQGNTMKTTVSEKFSETYTETYTLNTQLFDNEASYCNKYSEMVNIDQIIVPSLSVWQGYVLARSWMFDDFKVVNLGSKMNADNPNAACAIIAAKKDQNYGGSLCVFKNKNEKVNKITTQMAYEGGATTFTIKDTTNGVYIERYSVAD